MQFQITPNGIRRSGIVGVLAAVAWVTGVVALPLSAPTTVVVVATPLLMPVLLASLCLSQVEEPTDLIRLLAEAAEEEDEAQ